MEGRVGEAAQESAVRVTETIKKSQMGTGGGCWRGAADQGVRGGGGERKWRGDG